MSTRRSSAWRLFPALAVLALLALALSGLSERWSGPDLPFRLRRLQVVPHDPAGPSLAPLRAGDRLIAVNGRILRRDGSALGALAGALRQGPAWVQVERGGVRQELRGVRVQLRLVAPGDHLDAHREERLEEGVVDDRRSVLSKLVTRRRRSSTSATDAAASRRAPPRPSSGPSTASSISAAAAS